MLAVKVLVAVVKRNSSGLAELSPNSGDERGQAGYWLELAFLCTVVELYTEDDFGQLVVTAETMPTFLGGLCELEDHS